jgi:hypothetical protein
MTWNLDYSDHGLIEIPSRHLPAGVEGKKNKTNKLRGLQSASELYRLIDRHRSAKFSANFCGERGVAWSARRIPYGE